MLFKWLWLEPIPESTYHKGWAKWEAISVNNLYNLAIWDKVRHFYGVFSPIDECCSVYLSGIHWSKHDVVLLYQSTRSWEERRQPKVRIEFLPGGDSHRMLVALPRGVNLYLGVFHIRVSSAIWPALNLGANNKEVFALLKCIKKRQGRVIHKQLGTLSNDDGDVKESGKKH